MRQKHAKCDFLAAGVFFYGEAFGESGQQLDQWLVKIEHAAIVQDHAGWSGGDDLGYRGEIIDGFGSYGRGHCVISEMPEAFVGDQLSLMGDGDCCAGESALVDAGAKDVKSMLESLILTP